MGASCHGRITILKGLQFPSHPDGTRVHDDPRGFPGQLDGPVRFPRYGCCCSLSGQIDPSVPPGCLGDLVDAALSTFLASTWRTSSAEDRAHALARLAWDARDRPLPYGGPGPARALAARLCRAAREQADSNEPFTVAPDETTDPLTQMRAAVLLGHAALRSIRRIPP